jgi:membrane protease YdiL (CAAX protease family)
MHGPAGIFGFPFVGTLAMAMSWLYHRTGRRLQPGMTLHALLDLSILLT